MVAFAILGLAACGQRQNQGTPSPSSTGTAPSASSAGTAPSAAPEAAKPDVGAAANPDATSCLDLVANEMYSDAIPACERALRADATNEKVKSALAAAQAKLVDAASKAAGGAAESAQGAADAAKGAGGSAEDAAKGAAGSVPAPPKTY
jgi:hypothetical protein